LLTVFGVVYVGPSLYFRKKAHSYFLTKGKPLKSIFRLKTRSKMKKKRRMKWI